MNEENRLADNSLSGLKKGTFMQFFSEQSASFYNAAG